MTQPAQEQQVLAAPATAATFLVLTVRRGAESAVRDLLADAGGLLRSVGFRAPEAHLSQVIGIGSKLWDRLYDGPRPRELHPLRQIDGPTHTAVSTPGDLLFHLRAARADLCFELARRLTDRLSGHADVVDEVHGLRYFDERDILGFVDGTENPRGDAAAESVFIDESDPDFAGGSYVIVQKYVHDLASWDALTVEEQEAAFGRHKLSDMEFPDEDKASNSHLTLNTIVDPDGTQRQVVRDNMVFGSVAAAEFGTYYIAYSATPSVTEQMLENMFVGVPPGNHDRILDFSTALTGGLFFVPTADFLDDQPPPAGAVATAGADPAETVDEQPDSDGSLGIGSLAQGVTTP